MLSKISNAIFLVFMVMVVAFGVLNELRESSLDVFSDKPTWDFTQALLKKNDVVRIVEIDPHSFVEKSVSLGRRSNSVVQYSHRSFVIHKQGDENPQDLYEIEGQVRCYPERRTLNPFDKEEESTYCEIHEQRRTLIQSKASKEPSEIERE